MDSAKKSRCSQSLLGEHGKITYTLIVLALLALVMLFLFASSATFTQTTATDFNSGTGYDHNYTKVTSDNNVMPSGELTLPSTTEPPSGLVGFWQLDDKDTNTVYDDSGQGNNGTLQNGADTNGTWFFDQNAGFFDGVNDYVGMGDVLDMGLNDRTLEAWINVSAFGEMIVVGKAYSDTDPAGFALEITPEGEVRAILQRDPDFIIDYSISLNKWYHVVGTLDRDGYMRLYVNGIERGTAEDVSATSGTNFSSEYPFSIGAAGWQETDFFSGQIAQVKVFDRALNPTEIATEYNRNLDGNGLVAYYTFNDTNSDGSGIIDYAGYDQNGALVGGADINAYGMWDTNAGFFDGVNDYINVSSQNNVMGISTALTEEAWVKFPQAFDINSNEDFVLLDAGSHKLFFDSTSGKLSLEAVNQTQGSWAISYDSDKNRVNTSAVYDGNLYAGFGYGTGLGDIFTFDGTTWSMSYDGDQEAIWALAAYDGNLYAGYGSETGDGDVLTFDGTTWSTSYDGDEESIHSLAVYDGNLYAGQGANTDGDGNVLTFDGTTWSMSYDGAGSAIYSLAAYDGNLYAGSGYGTGLGDIFTFDGTTWSTSYDGDKKFVGSLAVYDGNLFAGQGGSSSGDGNIFTFDGTTWSMSYDGAGSAIHSLAAYDGNLYAGSGYGTGLGDIFTFDGTTWSTSYDGSKKLITSLAVYDGNLFAGQGSGLTDGNIFTFGNGFSVSTSQNSWNATQWYHIAATFDGSTASLYVNGEQDGSRSKSMTIDNLQNNRFSKKAFIGRATGTRQMGIDESFHAAVIDELRIYNTALSAAEIAADYNSWMQSHYYSKVFDANSTAHWTTMSWGEFIDVNNTLSVDYRSCDDASCIGESWTTGLWGGSTSHALSTSNNRYFQYRVNFDTNTASWNAGRTGDTDKGSYAKFTNANIGYDYVSDVNITKIDGNPDNLGLPIFSYANDGNLTIDVNITDRDNYRTHYLDLNYSSSNTQGAGTKIVDNLTVDGNYCETNFINNWAEDLTDVNLVGYWKFNAQEDDTNSIQAYDYSQYGNHGQYIGGADNNAQGKWDTNAGFFDAVDDYVVVPVGSTSKDLNINDKITIMAWVYPTITGQHGIVSGAGGWEYAYALYLRDQADNQVSFAFNDSGTRKLIQVGNLTNNTWYHLAATYDGTTMYIYINGVQYTETIATNTVAHLFGGGEIGYAAGVAVPRYFDGSIEELKIYDKALTATEISLDYNYGLINKRKCSYDFNIHSSLVGDGNYFILAEVSDGTDTDFNASDNNFMIDNTAPTTTSDINATWQNFDANVTLTCTDTNSGCSTTKYKLDTDSSNTVSLGSWQTWDGNGLYFYKDGNWAIDFNSTDVAGNIETTNRAYALVDKTNPSTVADYNAEWQNKDANVTFSCTDANSGCATTGIRLDTDDSDGVSYGSWITNANATDLNAFFSTDGNWAVDFNSTDVAGNIEDTNTIYVLVDKTNPETVADYNADWQNIDANVTFTCSDVNSGCQTTGIRLDTDDTNSVTYGSWTTGNAVDLNAFFTTDGNWAVDFNSTDAVDNIEDTNTIYVLIDKTNPETVADYNADWQNNDANVTFTCTDINSGCATTGVRIDTDDSNSVTYGSWITGNAVDLNVFISADGNWAVDFNSTDAAGNIEDTNTIYLLVDQTTPIVTITSPTNGFRTSGPPQFTLVYTPTEPNVKKYWVRIDSGNWIDNGSNTSYTFTVSSENTKAYTLSVKLQDLADNNSAAASVSVMFVRLGEAEVCGNGFCGSGENCSNCPRDCGVCGVSCASLGGVVCSDEEECDGSWVGSDDDDYCSVGKFIPKEIITEVEEVLLVKNTYIPLEEENLPILDITEKEMELRLKRLATREDLRFSRSLKVQALFGISGIIKYRNIISILIENISTRRLEGIELIEGIPKEFAENSSMIGSDSNFIVLEEDPLLKFQVGDLGAGEKTTVSYDFNRSLEKGQITEDMFNSMDAPAALIKLTEGDLCMGVYCNDFNPCTRDYCVKGECVFAPMNDGAKCGVGMVCKEGQCVKEGEEPPKKKEPDYTVLIESIAVLIIIGVAIGAGYVAVKKFKKPGEKGSKIGVNQKVKK